MRDDGMNLHGSSLMVPELGQGGVAGSIMISLPDTRATPPTIRALREMFLRHKGDGEVRLRLTKGDVGRIYELPYAVQTTGDFFGELKSLLGPGCLV